MDPIVPLTVSGAVEVEDRRTRNLDEALQVDSRHAITVHVDDELRYDEHAMNADHELRYRPNVGGQCHVRRDDPRESVRSAGRRPRRRTDPAGMFA